MRWVTRAHVHLDRVACPWLIRRFIDADAEFVFVPWRQEHLAPADAIPFSMPGAALGPHDAEGTTFAKMLRAHSLADPALLRIARVVELGVAHVVRGYRPAPDDEDGQVAVGILTFAEGFPLFHRDDLSILEASFPMFDALYARYRVLAAMADRSISMPDGSDGRGPTRRVETMRLIYDGLAS